MTVTRHMQYNMDIAGAVCNKAGRVLLKGCKTLGF